jgi:signal transduction histidine kinase
LPKSLISNGLTKNDVDIVKQKMSNEELAAREKSADILQSLLLQSKIIQQLGRKGLSVDKELLKVAIDVPEYLIFHRVMSAGQQIRLQGYVVKRKPYIAQIMMETMVQSHFDSAILVELRDIEHTEQADYFLYQNLSNDQVKISPLSKMDIADKRFQQHYIYNKNLLWPFRGYRVTVSVGKLPMTPAMVYSGIFIFVLIIVVLLACYGFYHIGVKQLKLGEQRLNFVSSVSHELKTPLTSIQMYSQMLKEGTVLSESHQQKYFDFIFGESERLTRLINNILQLSSLGNKHQKPQPEFTSLAILQDIIRSKTSSIMEKHDFQLNMVVQKIDASNVRMLVEPDAFAQIVINITDNAVKFFNKEKINDVNRQKVDFIFCQHPKYRDMVQLEIRDYGEGITSAQESKIFDLFYRGGNELTRTTQGTGIGLALVNELVLAQQGSIKVEKREAGLAMLLSFKAKY